jgi:multidrug efflux pump
METVLQAITRGYGHTLNWTLRHRWVVLLVMVASGFVSWLVLGDLKRELSPVEDRGVVVAQINGPDGATLDFTNRYAKVIERIGEGYPEFDRIFSTVGNPTVAQGNIFFRAVPWEDRKRTTLEMAREMTPRVSSLSGVTAFPITPPSLGQGFTQRPINFVIITSDSYQNLAQTVRAFQDELAKNPGFVQVDTDLRLNKPEIKLEVDRERAADMGVGVDLIARAVETMLGGRKVTRYKREGEQYDVIVQTNPSGRATPDDIEKIFVRGRNETMIPLSALVKIRRISSMRAMRSDQSRFRVEPNPSSCTAMPSRVGDMPWSQR